MLPASTANTASGVSVAEIPGFDAVELFGQFGARLDLLVLDVGAGILDRLDRPVDSRLDVELAGSGDEQSHRALADEVDDVLAHRHTRPEEVLADVGQAGVGGVGVVRDDRDPGVERLLDRVVEGLEIDERHGDPVGLCGDRRLEGVDHLGDVGGLRTRPLDVGAEQHADASSMPNWVGVKNGFVVTWLTNTKFHSGVSGKFPALRVDCVLDPAARDAVDVPGQQPGRRRRAAGTQHRPARQASSFTRHV